MKIHGHNINLSEEIVWKGIASGLDTKAMATRLKKSRDAVMSHRRNLYRKLRVKCAADATRAAVRHGVIRVEVLP